MTMALWVDAVVAGLLVVTIAYAVLLNRRLSNLRQGRVELEAIVGEFKTATEQAQSAVERLKQSASARQSDLAEQVESARALRDELAFLADRGASEANRLEGLIKQGRSTEAAQNEQVSEQSGSAADRELFKSLAGLR